MTLPHTPSPFWIRRKTCLPPTGVRIDLQYQETKDGKAGNVPTLFPTHSLYRRIRLWSLYIVVVQSAAYHSEDTIHAIGNLIECLLPQSRGGVLVYVHLSVLGIHVNVGRSFKRGIIQAKRNVGNWEWWDHLGKKAGRNNMHLHVERVKAVSQSDDSTGAWTRMKRKDFRWRR